MFLTCVLPPTGHLPFDSRCLQALREYLDNLDFVEIHTPKLQGAATESGSSVFKVSYFKGQAFLAQSPQLAKQMAIAADFGRVYEIGPVFRAEDSNTHRHMTEFTGLDLEMSFDEHYHEVVDTLDGLFTFIFRELPKRYRKEIDAVKRQFPCEEFLLPEKTVRLQYKDAIALLREAGREIGDYEDLSTEMERFLGGLVRDKYKTDFYMLDKFPLEIRPFYTMPDPVDHQVLELVRLLHARSRDLVGAQRVHDAAFLEKRMAEFGIPVESMKHYVEAFRLGCPPHAGGGIVWKGWSCSTWGWVTLGEQVCSLVTLSVLTLRKVVTPPYSDLVDSGRQNGVLWSSLLRIIAFSCLLGVNCDCDCATECVKSVCND